MYRKAIWCTSSVPTLGLVNHASAALPAGWSDRDIGTTGGSADEAGGMWTVSGDGADVWGSADAFHFVYLPLSGNGAITAHVVSHGNGSSTWSKGGVMIRETLTPGSKHAIMAITGGNGGGLAFQNRPTTGGRSYTAHGNPIAAPPYWVRLTREGDTITAYSSADGINWVQQPDGTDTYVTPNPVEIPMAADDLFDNVMFSTDAQQRTFFLQINYDDVYFGRSDNNWLYSPYADQHIRVDWYGPYRREDMTLDGWRALSGYDGNSRDFAYLGQFADIQVDLIKQSRIIYNPSLEAVTLDLGSDTYCDVQGNKIYGQVSLLPFESMILMPADIALPSFSPAREREIRVDEKALARQGEVRTDVLFALGPCAQGTRW